MRPPPSGGSACRLLLRGGTLGPACPPPPRLWRRGKHLITPLLRDLWPPDTAGHGLIYILTPEGVTAFIGMVFSIYQYSRRLYLIYR